MSNTIIDNITDENTYLHLVNRSIDEFIDDEINYIGAAAFYGCYNLNNIDCPNVNSI